MCQGKLTVLLREAEEKENKTVAGMVIIGRKGRLYKVITLKTYC